MEEIKIARKAWIVPLGAIGSIVALVVAGIIFNAADGPTITSPITVKAIAVFLVAVALFAIFLIVRELFFPRHLIINEEGINNQFSFGLLKWNNIQSIGRFEGMVGSGKYRTVAHGIAIQVHDRDALLKQVTGTRRIGVRYSENKWGTPAVIYSSTWSLNMDLIEDVLKRYLAQHDAGTDKGQEA